ncbi:MAG TPA: TolC family protein [Labilithrix sp.]
MLPSVLVATTLFLQAAPDLPPSRVLRLNDAVEAGLKNQPTVRQARAQTRVFDNRADEAKAPLLPQVTAIASYQRVRGAARSGTVTTTGAPSTIPTSTPASGVDVFTFGASASQLIWDFGQTYEKYRAADRLASSAKATEQTAEYTTVADVRRSYFTARAQKALVKVAADSLANLDRHLVQIEGFVKVGTRPEIDLAQARTDVANGKVALIDAENAYALAKAQLARSMGDPGATDFEVSDDEIAPVDGEDLSADALTARAIAGRPELQALGLQRESNRLTVRALKGGYGPALTANAGYSQTGTALNDLGPAWNVGVALTWPLFQGGVTRAQVREAEASEDLTDAQVDAEKLQIALDVRTASLNLRAAKATATASEDVVVNARERLRLAEGRYESGVGSAIELGDAQVALTQAEGQLVGARFRVSSARSDLLAAMGKR